MGANPLFTLIGRYRFNKIIKRGDNLAKHIEKAIWDIASDIMDGTDIELVDVEYVKEHDWYLRVFIDKPEGIGIDDCQMFSEKLEAVLDEKEIIDDSYILEVSSPGLDRILKNARDVEGEKGKKVDITLYEAIDGSKKMTGTLTDHSDDALLIDTDKTIPMSKIAQVRLHIDI